MDKGKVKSKVNKNDNSKVILQNKYRLSNAMISLITALFLLVFDFWSIIRFDFGYSYSLLVVLVSLLMYIILLSVLSKTSYKKRIQVRDSQNRDEVIKALVKEVEGIEKEQSQNKIINATNPTYIGSTDSKVYHKIGCRYAKNIKSNFRLENNSEKFFQSKKFTPCGSCLKKK